MSINQSIGVAGTYSSTIGSNNGSNRTAVTALCNKAVVLTLITRHNCSLCEDMQYLLQDFAGDLNYSVELKDVDTDPDLQRQFTDFVPVLMLDNNEICHHFLDRQALVRALDAERISN